MGYTSFNQNPQTFVVFMYFKFTECCHRFCLIHHHQSTNLFHKREITIDSQSPITFEHNWVSPELGVKSINTPVSLENHKMELSVLLPIKHVLFAKYHKRSVLIGCWVTT